MVIVDPLESYLVLPEKVNRESTEMVIVDPLEPYLVLPEKINRESEMVIVNPLEHLELPEKLNKGVSLMDIADPLLPLVFPEKENIDPLVNEISTMGIKDDIQINKRLKRRLSVSLESQNCKKRRIIKNNSSITTNQMIPNRGITNFGNDCFINSIFQKIFHSKNLLDMVMGAQNCPTRDVLLSAMRKYSSGDLTQPVDLQHESIQLRGLFNCGNNTQDDIGIILRGIMENLNPPKDEWTWVLGVEKTYSISSLWVDQTGNNRPPTKSSWVKDYIEIDQNYKSMKSEEGTIIELLRQDKPFMDLLCQHFTEFVVTGGTNNRVGISGGDNSVYNAQLVTEKWTPLTVPKNLVFSITKGCGVGTWNPLKDVPFTIMINGRSYQLQSFSSWRGNYSQKGFRGHYWETVKCPTGWIQFNDREVKPLRENDLTTAVKEASVLFFKEI